MGTQKTVVMTQLEVFYAMIVSKYFKSIQDFRNLILVNKKYVHLTELFHYNPIAIKKKNIFPNLQTQALYFKKNFKIKGIKQFIYCYTVTHDEYLKMDYPKPKCLHIQLTPKSDSIDLLSKKCEIPQEVNSLGPHCFSASELRHVELPIKITSVYDNCFSGCSIKTIKLAPGIARLPASCFSRCISLKEIDLSYVRSIGKKCFEDCSSLTSITLCDFLCCIENTAFDGCFRLAKIDVNSLKRIKFCVTCSLARLLEGKVKCKKVEFTLNDRKKYGDIIPTDVDRLGDDSFKNCRTIVSIALPSRIRSIGQNCFYGCSLTKLVCESYVNFEQGSLYQCRLENKNAFPAIAFKPLLSEAEIMQ